MSWLAILVAVATLLAAPPLVQTWVVERGRVGQVAIGDTAESLVEEFDDRARLVDLRLEGQFSPALELKLVGAQLAPSLVAEIGPSKGTFVVSRIHVLDPAIRTKANVGVGSTYAELRAAYPIEWVGAGETGFFARVEALAISFELDVRSQVPQIRDPGQVPGSTRVVRMMLTR